MAGYDYGNVLAAIAKGVNFDPFGNLVEGWKTGNQLAALHQSMAEKERIKNALEQAAKSAQSGDYRGTAGSLIAGGEAAPGINLLTYADPSLAANKENFGVNPIMLEGPGGVQIPYQLSNRGRGQAVNLPEGTHMSPKWQYLPDQYGNYHPVPKQGSGNQPDTTPPETPYAPPGEPQEVKAQATQRGENKAAAENLLPEQLQAFGATEKLINQVAGNKNLPYAVGLWREHPLMRTLGEMPSYLGGHAQEVTDLNNQIGSLKGQAFLNAYLGLKGGGQISNVEGEKATQAQFRLNNATSEKEIKTALSDMQALMKGKLEITMARARGPKAPQQGGNNVDLSDQGRAAVEQEVADLKTKLPGATPDQAMAVLKRFMDRHGLDEANARRLLGM